MAGALVAIGVLAGAVVGCGRAVEIDDAGVDAAAAEPDASAFDPATEYRRLVAAECGDGVGELEPARHGERVDRREVDDHLGDAIAAAQLDSHRRFLSTGRLLRQPNPA